MTIDWMIAGFCGLCVALLLWGEARGHAALKAAAKTAASLSFIGLAVAAGAMETAYGRLVLTALGFCLAGDVFLLSARKPLFLAGMGAFALGHAGYIAAFVAAGAGLTGPAPAALALSLAANGLILRWLWPHLGDFRAPVAIYTAIIGVMVGMSPGAAPQASAPDFMVMAGAVGFAVSDISVARDRFVRPGVANRLWGLPLYYGAQLLLAASV